MENRFSHHLGNGLLSSCRSSSHTWPTGLAFSPALRPGSVIQRLSTNMAPIPPSVRIAMNQLQNGLTKSAMAFISRYVRHIIVLKRHPGGGVERLLAPAAEGPGDDTDEDRHQQQRDRKSTR